MFTYSRLRRRFAILLLLSPLAASAKDKPRKAPVPNPASQYAAFDAHPGERVTIAAVPCEDPKACSFFRNAYVQHDFLPVWVVVSNDRDQPLSLDDVRIQFLPAEGDRIQAATPDDLNRGLFSIKRALPSHVPIIPYPIPIHHEPVDEKVSNDDTDFGFQSLTVAPHSTAAGYVFYDIHGLDDPVLKDAQLILKEIRTTDAKGNPIQLFSYAIPFNKCLAAQPPAKGSK
jgi:hypothetical protein